MSHKKILGIMSALVFFSGMAGCGLFVKTIPPGQIPAPTPFDHFIKVGGVNYHYLEFPGPGTTVVLLHGYGSSTYTWEGVIPYLRQGGYHVYALDMKGFGWSDKPRGADYAPLTLFQEVNGVMEALKLKKVVFVGNSLGGGIAVLMALDHPDKIERVVLIDAAGYPMKMPLIIRLSRVPLAAEFMKLFFERWVIRWNLSEVMYDGKKKMTKPQVEAYFDRLRTEGSLNAMIDLARAINFEDFKPYLARNHETKIPALIIWGREDKWIPFEIGQRFHQDISTSGMVSIPNCGHIPQEEYPKLTAGYIIDFIERKPAAGPGIP
ncbi:MAG: alpha/beta hydrolase [Proteobacteria bacterium]|nr:alpha/beta hydrolase [Pseudomonadota bacterium]